MTSPGYRHPTRAIPLHATLRIGVTGHGDGPVKARAGELASELALPWVGPDSPNFDLHLVLTSERLELRDARHPRLAPVYVDFRALDLRPYGKNLSRRQPLARAFGKKARTVVDATAGYGRDALLLAMMGFRVTAIERAPLIAALTRDGWQRLGERIEVDLAGRLRLVTGDARVLIPALAPRPDAIYLDPMFPPKRRKSAAVKKEIRLLRELVGDDADAPELLEISRDIARDRVVVKRPDDAPPLAPDPDMSLTGKLVRYDIYLARSKISWKRIKMATEDTE